MGIGIRFVTAGAGVPHGRAVHGACRSVHRFEHRLHARSVNSLVGPSALRHRRFRVRMAPRRCGHRGRMLPWASGRRGRRRSSALPTSVRSVCSWPTAPSRPPSSLIRAVVRAVSRCRSGAITTARSRRGRRRPHCARCVADLGRGRLRTGREAARGRTTARVLGTGGLHPRGPSRTHALARAALGAAALSAAVLPALAQKPSRPWRVPGEAGATYRPVGVHHGPAATR